MLSWTCCLKEACVPSHQTAPLSSSSPSQPLWVGPPACRVDPPGLWGWSGHGKDTTRNTATAQTHTKSIRQRTTLCLSCHLEPVLSLTQLSFPQRSSAEVVDRSEAPREGDVPCPALCQQLVVLHLLLHLSRNPELMLRGCPVQAQTWNHELCAAFKMRVLQLAGIKCTQLNKIKQNHSFLIKTLV